MLLFEEKTPFARTFQEVIRSLRAAAIDHVFMGAVALRAHGCADTTDEDIVAAVPGEDIDRFAQVFAGLEFEALPGQATRFYARDTQLHIELVAAEQPAGDPYQFSEIRWPAPSEAEWRAGVPVPSLARLLDLLLAQHTPAAREDVVLLIAANDLNAEFADALHPLTRAMYRACHDAWART